MKAIDKLIKFLNSKNVADELGDNEDMTSEQRLAQIARDVVTGYKIDEDSREDWLQVNKIAMDLIKNQDSLINGVLKNFPFENASKIVFPLLGPAVIQMGARLDQHVVRNGRVAEFGIIGPDQPASDSQTGQPGIQGIKQQKASRASEFISYQLLIKSDTWLLDQNKQNQIVSSWGVGFKKIYYDSILDEPVSELLNPEDVIINNSITSLDKAPRITIRRYLTKNDIIEKQRSGEFLDEDLDQLQVSSVDNPEKENDSQETNPVYEFLEQYCWLDLDDDGYAEPYCVYVHNQAEKVYAIYPAFDFADIKIEPTKGTILGIPMNHNIVDQHCIADPQGKYWSFGLNALLVHINLAINTILRQLLDAGTLANAAACTGFVTRAFKSREREMKIKLGQFNVIDLPPQVRIQDQMANMPFGEPSQVLLGLLQMMVQQGQQVGFMSDILTGDTQTQNTPATTMLAAVEQSTRAFKPVVQNLYQSQKSELKIICKLDDKHLNKQMYAQFCGMPVEIVEHDFDLKSLDIIPVADPTMSSEAHKFARLQLLVQLGQNPGFISAMNVQNTLELIYQEVEFPNPQAMIKPPAPPPPDPRLIAVQAQQQQADKDRIIKQQEAQIKGQKVQIDAFKAQTGRIEAVHKEANSQIDNMKKLVDAHTASANTSIQQQQIQIQKAKLASDTLKHAHDATIAEHELDLGHHKLQVQHDNNQQMAQIARTQKDSGQD